MLEPVIGKGTLDKPLNFNESGYAYLNYHTVKTEGVGIGEHPVHRYSIDYENIVFLDKTKADEYIRQKKLSQHYTKIKEEAYQEAVKKLECTYKQMLEEEFKRIFAEKIKDDDLLNKEIKLD